LEQLEEINLLMAQFCRITQISVALQAVTFLLVPELINIVVCDRVSLSYRGRCTYTWRHVLVGEEDPGDVDIYDTARDSIKDQVKMASRISSVEVNPSHFVRTLSGVRMPKLIYGTAWKKEQTEDLVVQAVRKGFRGIDTACQPKHYHEPGVGAALKRLIEEDGLKREDLFIQTKFTSLDGQDPARIPYDQNAPLTTQVQQSLEASLKNLGTTYIDSLVMHSPMRTMSQTLEVWKVFESFVDDGKVKQLGISNCYEVTDFRQLFAAARIRPSVIQNRFYKQTRYDKEIRKFCKENGIFYQSFWTLSANPHILSDKKVSELCYAHKQTSAQMLFAYLAQTGVVTPLTGTTDPKHMEEDLQVLDMPELTPQEKSVFGKLIGDE